MRKNLCNLKFDSSVSFSQTMILVVEDHVTYSRSMLCTLRYTSNHKCHLIYIGNKMKGKDSITQITCGIPDPSNKEILMCM